MKLHSALLALATSLLYPIVAQADACPALIGASSAYYTAITSTRCNTAIVLNADGTRTITLPNNNPYDGNDDNYVGVYNNTANTELSIVLTAGTDIFGFDGDGIDQYGISGNAADQAVYGINAYGGADATFSGINSSQSSGTVNFIGGIAPGGTGYFSLEEAPAAAGGTITTGPVITGPGGVTPEPSSLILLGTGALGVFGAARRRLSR